MEISEIAFKLEWRVLFPPSERCLYGADGSVAILTKNNVIFLHCFLMVLQKRKLLIRSVKNKNEQSVRAVITVNCIC